MGDTNEFRHTLRQQRMARGLSQDALGAEIHVSGSQVGNYEAGRSIPPDDVAAAIDAVLGTGGTLRQQAAIARKEAVAPWLRPWKDSERRAVLLRWFEHSIIPGLLQTEAYARMVIAAGPHTEVQVEEMTRERLDRQAVLDRAEPVALTAILDEAALRHGPPAVMKDQLDHLVDIGHRSTVHVRVVPFDAGLYAGHAGAFALAMLPDGGTVAYLDDQIEGRVVARAGELRRLVTVWERICARALPCDQSRALILRLVDEYEQQAKLAHEQPVQF
ncbi:helix-turn-helix domain-containing protein [Solwaraspora sp. WMMB335]|uniref:helix-turn-helix domain-containing protein n=1 Tax=Solwaraspora sp. WMMB335 TaxID=3404118 RepID=UPI003B935866